jgi:micrococcal nuclease
MPRALRPILPMLLLAALLPPLAGPARGQQDTVRVVRVVDGDTVALASGGLLRYIGIDAPEERRRVAGRWVPDPEPFARAATEANRRLVAGREVRLRYDRERTDRYGRVLAYVYVGDVFVNEKLVLDGLARARAYPPNLRHQAARRRAEAEARAAGRGLWSAPDAAAEAPVEIRP